MPPANSWELNMKKIAAGVGVVALVVVAQIALADDTARTTTQSGSSMTITGDPCAGWTKGGGASVGKPNNGRAGASASASMDASTEAACAAAASGGGASSSSSSSAQGVVKTKTKSNQSND
jgi:hypothetical protein